MKRIGLFGGTFNPVHCGHLRLALEVQQAFELDQLSLLPCHVPPHRQTPSVNAEVRAEMLALAVADCPLLSVDNRELQRQGPSYTVDTLREVRREQGEDVSISWLMGMDSLAQLQQWHCWQELLALANLIVLARPEYSLPNQGPVADYLRQHQTNMMGWQGQVHGALVLASVRELPISATDIREQIAAGHSPQYLLPSNVWRYIQTHNLYSCD